MIGTRTEAMVDWPDGGIRDGASVAGAGAHARLSCQADDIDGVTTLDRCDLAAGSIVEVRVDDVVDDYDFVATVQRVVSTPPASDVRRPRPMLPMATAMSTAGSFGR